MTGGKILGKEQPWPLDWTLLFCSVPRFVLEQGKMLLWMACSFLHHQGQERPNLNRVFLYSRVEDLYAEAWPSAMTEYVYKPM